MPNLQRRPCVISFLSQVITQYSRRTLINIRRIICVHLSSPVATDVGYRCRLSMSATDVVYRCRLPMSATDVGYRCRLPMSATDVGYRCRPPMSATDVGYRCRLSSFTANHFINSLVAYCPPKDY